MADFRTQGALLRTQAHLRSILNRTDKPFANIFGFVWDRFRGMRQDMYVQGMQVSGPDIPCLLCTWQGSCDHLHASAC